MKTPIQQIAFKLINTQATNVQFDIYTDFVHSKKSDQIILKLMHEVYYSNEDLKKFIVVFDVSVESKLKIFELNLTFKALFETLEEITPEFKQSSFVEKSAPAITFPFIRAFIANFSVNAGLKAIMLPPINFVTDPISEDKELIERALKMISKKPLKKKKK